MARSVSLEPSSLSGRYLAQEGREALVMATATQFPPAHAHTLRGAAKSVRIYTCPQCDHVLRVSGLGRHRVFFEPDDRLADHPVMDRMCPECRHGLPGKNRP